MRSLILSVIAATYLFSGAAAAEPTPETRLVPPPPAATIAADEAPTASPEYDYTTPVEKKPKKKSRRVASTDSDPSSYEELRVRNPRRSISAAQPYDLRLGGLAGFSLTGSSTTDASFSNVMLALQADFRMFRYFGAELDVYGDLFTGKFETSTGAKESKQTYGGLFNLKGQVPFRVGRAIVIPKAGLGFGLNNVGRASTPSGTTATATTTTNSTTGVYGVVGVDVEPTEKLVLSADFATSFGASGARDTATATTTLDDASFSRFRLGGYYRVAPHLGAGAQFIYRSTSSVDTATDNSPKQILGMFLYEL